MSLATPIAKEVCEAAASPTKARSQAVSGFGDASFWEKLTWLRGLLAFYVVLHHTRNEMWPNLRDLQGGTIWYYWNASLLALCHHGLQAVFLFFLVSGLSIHGATLRKPTAQFSATHFYYRRLRRLMPPLLASLVTSAFFYALFQHGDLRTQLGPLLGTLTFQQEVLVGSFAGNAPYWSLAHEGYYYLLYPALLFVARRYGSWSAVVGFTFLSVALWMVLPLGGRLAAFYPVWLAGFWLAELLASGRGLRPGWVAFLCAVSAVSLVTNLLQRTHPALGNELWQGAFGVALVAPLYLWVTRLEMAWFPAFAKKCLSGLGDMSYSLYLCHYPVVSALGSMVPDAKQHFASAVAMSLVTIASSLGLGWVLYRCAEKPWLAHGR